MYMFRESSFNMTVGGGGGGGGDEDIEGWLQKFLDTQKGGSEKIVGLGVCSCTNYKHANHSVLIIDVSGDKA